MLEPWMIANKAPMLSAADIQFNNLLGSEAGGALRQGGSPTNYGWGQSPFDTSSFYSPYNPSAGDSGGEQSLNIDAMQQWLDANGYKMNEAWQPGEVARWIEGSGGVVPDSMQRVSTNEDNFWTGALLAGALAGGAAYGAAGGSGAGSLAGAGEISAPAWGSGLTAETAAGLVAPGATAPMMTAPAAFGGGGLGAVAGGAIGSEIMAPAYGSGLTAETAAGLTAPGATAPMMTAPGAFGGGAIGSGGGLLNMLKDGASTVGGLLKDNPQLVGAIAGGVAPLLGGDSDSGPAPYDGPMPTITRGDWKPRVNPQYMQVPTFGGGLLGAQPQAGSSGLLRYRS